MNAYAPSICSTDDRADATAVSSSGMMKALFRGGNPDAQHRRIDGPGHARDAGEGQIDFPLSPDDHGIQDAGNGLACDR